MEKNNMKTLILNASPKAGGTISQMIQQLCREIPDKESFEIVNVNKLVIKPCTGCMHCRTSGSCILPHDDGHETGDKMEKAENIVIGAPVYWGNMPGSLKILFDRNVYRFMGESKLGIPAAKMKGKKGYILTACTTPFPFNVVFRQSTGLIKSISEIYKTGGIKLVKAVTAAGTKNKKTLSLRCIRKLKAAGRMLG
jgi:hypothetical protein